MSDGVWAVGITASVVKADLCHLCPFFGRPMIRKKDVKMLELIQNKEHLHLRVCRDCLRNMASMLKRGNKND
jgi:hypothetical protein